MTNNNQFQDDQIKAIKKRLNDALNVYIAERGIPKESFNYNELKNSLIKHTNFEINYTTLQRTLDMNDTKSCNLLYVIALCRLFHLNISTVLADPDNDETLEIYPTPQQTKTFMPLDKEQYYGTYHGFLLSSKSHEPLNRFILEITKDEFDKPTATLNVTIPYKKDDGTMDNMFRKLTGTPMLAVKQNNIHIVFTDEPGNYYIFDFSYTNYRVQNLYFRRGSVLTHSRSTSHPPIMQSFVLFSHEITPEFEELIPGMLLLINKSFHIVETDLNELLDNNPLIKRFYENFKYLFKSENTYTINEMQVLNEEKPRMSQNEILAALQILKSKAIEPALIYFDDKDEYSEFSKDLHN